MKITTLLSPRRIRKPKPLPCTSCQEPIRQMRHVKFLVGRPNEPKCPECYRELAHGKAPTLIRLGRITSDELPTQRFAGVFQ